MGNQLVANKQSLGLLNKYFNENGDLKEGFRLEDFLKSDYRGNYLEFVLSPNQNVKYSYNRARELINICN